MTGRAPHLVGRDRELKLLAGLLDEACSGSSRCAIIGGEPGIGKTSLLVELLARADAHGCLALHGSASEFERELPMGVVVDALDEYVGSLDPQSFSRVAADDLTELARVFPALRGLDPGSGRPTTAAERFRTHHVLRELIERLAESQPVVLAFDDLHWADGASLELVSYLIRHPPRAGVLVAATFRSGQVDAALVTTVERAIAEGKPVELVTLAPLGAADAVALLEGAGATTGEGLYEAAGGNPFYLLQLARMSGDAPDRADATAGTVSVPTAVVAAIIGELDGLSATARRFAEAASVAGDPFELDLAAQAGDVGDLEALPALDELIARDLVRPTSVPRRFAFRHPLVRRAVYEACPSGSRLAAHARSADALAARGAPASARAHHVEHAARHGDLAAVAVLREAGEMTAQRAPLSAARWFEHALRLLPAFATPEERVELLTALADASAATGRFEQSRAALLQSVELMADAEEALLVRLIGACAAVEQLLGRYEEAYARLSTTLEGLTDRSSAAAVELMIHLAVGDLYRVEYEEMRDWGARALDAAEALREQPLTAASMAVLAVAEAFIGAIPAAQAHCDDARALIDGLGDDEFGLRLDSLANLATAELYLHRYDDAAAHAKRGLAIGRATGHGELSPVLIPVLGAALHMSGHIAESAELLDGAVEAARLSGNAQALGWNLLSRSFTAVAAGDLGAAVGLAEESFDITQDLDDSLVFIHAGVALANALFESGEAARAIEVLTRTTGGEELPLITGGWRTNYFELLTRCWLALDREDEAERAAGRAAATATRVGLRLADSMADRAAAALALAKGDPATAARAALDAATAADEIGARVDAARARTLAGRALAAAGESEHAAGELEHAVQQLDLCGAVRYRQEAELELRRLGRRVHRRTRPGKLDGSGLETLTEREADVARLVVDRRTNSEIADELFLSIKTIETHMHNIFIKLDVSSRVDVARAVESSGRPR